MLTSMPLRLPPAVPLELELRRFRISTAASEEELREVYALRADIFGKELGCPTATPDYDYDEYDEICDQVMFRDIDSGTLIGCTRFNLSRDSDRFYTDSEFDVAAFAQLPGDKVEMGRTCLHREWRNNLAIAAIGIAVSGYSAAAKAPWVFGCCTIPMTDPEEVAKLTSFLHADGSMLENLDVPVREDCVLPAYVEARERIKRDMPEAPAEWGRLMPPLLRGYLRAGAKLGAEPAWDPHFECFDYFTVLDMRESQGAFTRRYMPDSA